MEKVHQLVPMEDYHSEPEIVDEWFELDLVLNDQTGKAVQIPPQYLIHHPSALAKFLHRPAILKIFKVNLDLPIDPLQALHENPSPGVLIQSIKPILTYLEKENPYLLTYRFGVKEGMAMQADLEELIRLLEWSKELDYHLVIRPIRHYYSIKEERDVTQKEQRKFSSWM